LSPEYKYINTLHKGDDDDDDDDDNNNNNNKDNLQPSTYEYIQLQKSVILGTCSIVRNFLNYK